MTLVDRQFEDFWQLYPRKAGKKSAKRSWADIAPDKTLVATIMTALNAANRYWQSYAISQKHIPHPATWLDEERWEDEYPTAKLSTGGEKRENYTIGGFDDPYRGIMQN